MEQRRLQELHNLDILDSQEESDFDEIVELASALFDVPISLISLIDVDRQWFKAKVGIEICETEREYAFCSYAIDNPSEIMIVENALEDIRFSKNPLVTGFPNIRFYAGVPLMTKNNQALGTLCIIDTEPKSFGEKEQKTLKILANKVMSLIELRRENLSQRKIIQAGEKELSELNLRLIEAQQVARIGSWNWDVAEGDLYWSPQMFEIFGISPTKKIFEAWQAAVHEDDLDLVKKTLARGLEGKNDIIQYRIIRESQIMWVETNGKVSLNDRGEVVRMMGTVQEITERKVAEEQKKFYSDILEQMLFDLSHKIRKPLTNCIALASLLSDPECSHGRQEEFSKYLKESAETLDEYVRDTTNFLYENKIKISDS